MNRPGWTRLLLISAACLFGLVATTGSAIAAPGDAKITRTDQSVANIEASDLKGAGYGIGYAMAEDNICTLAEIYLNLRGERARYFGPSGINNDLYNAYLNSTGKIQKTIAMPPPAGPSQDALDLLDGYIKGYNEYIAHTGVANIPDPRCRGEAWVRPIDRMDVARRVYQLSGLGGRDLVKDGMLAAQPPSGWTIGIPLLPPLTIPGTAEAQNLLGQAISGLSGTDLTNVQRLASEFADSVDTRGSNAIGLGSQGTANGSGALLANPHWNWDGYDKFWQMQIDVPGKMHSAGMSFIGIPLVMIGHNEHVAWTHTVSAARRFALVQVPLVPFAPTKYFVDGRIRTMDKKTVTISVKESNGQITQRSRSFYSTIYGPVVTSVMGISLTPWTSSTATSVVDLNAENGRMVNQFIESNQATSAEDLYRVHAKYSANPWATTTASDDQGKTLFTDVGTVPNISNTHAALCNTVLGQATWNLLGVAILRGGLSKCGVPTSRDSAAPQTMPADEQPVIRRRDYVENSNESSWLANVHEPLTGYSRVFGPAGTKRAMRTRLGHRIALDRINGTDGMGGPSGFTRSQLQAAVFNNRNMLGELWASDLADLCDALPTMLSSKLQAVNVAEACPVLRHWDRTDNLDSPGAALFKRFSELTGVSNEFMTAYTGLPVDLPFWKVPYNPADPVNTPRGLNPLYPTIGTALADTVQEFRAAGIPLGASLRGLQVTNYGGSPVSIHGGQGTLGLFNALATSWNGHGFTAGGNGASFVQVTTFGGSCPEDRTLLLGSQRSELSGWPRSGDQVRLYADKQWVDPPFCPGELANSNIESVTELGPNGVE